MRYDKLPLRFDSAQEFLIDHEGMVFKFLNDRIRDEDQERAMDELMEKPVILANMLKNNYRLTPTERKEKVLDLVAMAGNVTVMIGAKRWGKTCTAFWMIEAFLAMGIKVYWYGYSAAITKLYPRVVQTFDIKTVKDGVLFIDEAAVFNAATDFAQREQKDKMKQIFTSGHNDYSTVYISQTFRINILILNAMDVLWFKPFFNMDFDREKAQDMFSDTYEYMKPIRKDENMVINRQENNSWFFTNELPAKWCDALSKPFARLKDKEEALHYMGMMGEAGMPQREMETAMKQRGFDINDILGESSLQDMQAAQHKRKQLEGTDLMLCDKCGLMRIEKKELRKGKQIYRCADCGRTGPLERFKC